MKDAAMEVPASRIIGTMVQLKWEPSAGARFYEVKVAAKDSGPYRVIATGLTTPGFKDEAAINGRTYFYRVAATNANGTSGSSEEVSITLPKSHAATHMNH